jgi:integrase
VESAQKTTKRSRGTIRKHRAGHQIRVSAGTDPVTGERFRLQGTAPTMKEAEKLRTKLLGEADTFRSARTNASLGYLLNRWLPQHDIEEDTRESYESLIRVHIRPALGDLPLTTLVRKATELVEQFYGELRRCRERCDGRTQIDHKTEGEHDCAAASCRPHVCRPLAAATVCRIHAVLSAACRAALRWGWIPFNPMDAVRQPSKPKPSPQPPTRAETARLVEEATRQDPEWGLYLWLAVVTGARRGEMCALRWTHLDLDAGVMTVRRNYVWGREKDPKNHQMRRLSLDAATVELRVGKIGVQCRASAQRLIGGVDRSVETINRGRVAKLRKHVAVPAGQVSLVQLQVRQLGLIERGQVLGRPIERLATAHAVIRGGQDLPLARPQPGRHDPRHVGLGDLTSVTD